MAALLRSRILSPLQAALRPEFWVPAWVIGSVILAGVAETSLMLGHVPGQRGLAVSMQGAVMLMLMLCAGAVHWMTPVHSEPDPERPRLRAGIEFLLVLLLVNFALAIQVGVASGPVFDPVRQGMESLVQWLNWPFAQFLPQETLLASRLQLGITNSLIPLGFTLLLTLALGSRYRLEGLSRFHLGLGFLVSGPLILLWGWQILDQPTAFGSKAIILLTNLIVAGYGQEFLWRGALQPRLIATLRNPALGILIAGLLFGLWHVPGLITGGMAATQALMTAIIVHANRGLLLGFLAWRTRSLVVPTILHMWLITF